MQLPDSFEAKIKMKKQKKKEVRENIFLISLSVVAPRHLLQVELATIFTSAVPCL